MPRQAALALMVMLSGAVTASAAEAPAPDPQQGDGRVSAFYTWQGAIPATPGKLLRQEPLDPVLGLPSAAAGIRILYSSTGGADAKSPVAVSGLVFLPTGTPPAGGWPLFVWAHETAGMADVCAPSWSGYSTRVEAFLDAWLEQGFAIVATDYEGLGTPGPNPYTVVLPEAYDVLDSIRAAQQGFTALGKKIVLAGYSQGAGAALAAAALQPTYAPGLDIRGTVATGMPYLTPETVGHLRDSDPNRPDATLIYALYIGRMAQQREPGLKAADMFGEAALPLFDLTRRACVFQVYLEVLSDGVTRAQSVKPAYTEALMRLLPALEYPTLKLPQPIFIGIGANDRDTPAALQRALAKDACVAGTTVEAHVYLDARHDTAVTRSLPDALPFVKKVMAGETVAPACSPEPEY